MATMMTSGDLRRLATALDAMAEMTRETGVIVDSYGTAQVTIDDHAIRIYWREADGDEPGRYVAEWPDSN